MNMRILGVCALTVGASTTGRAQASYKKEVPDSLVRQAKITEAAAAATARARVPRGTIQSVELEKEKGRLIYSYSIKTTGKRGIDEVNVDATTGKIVAFAHETPADEKKEAAEDAKASVSAQGAYRITQTYSLGGEGSWDYLVPDPARHRVYVGRSDRVMVVDERTGKLEGVVTGIHGAHGTAVADRIGRGFATSGDDSSIVMFDLASLKVLGRIHAAEDADAIIYDAPSDRVFSFNGDAHSATVVDATAGKIAANIDLGGKPEYGASAGDGKVYANLTDNGEVVEIDARALKVTRRWSTAPCKNPVAMAIDTTHRRLFSGCRSGVMAVSDYKNGKVVATVPIGAGVDGAGFDSATGDAFASNADGTLTIIHQDSPDTYRVVQTLTTMERSRNMGLDPVTHAIYIAGAKFEPAQAGQRPKPLPNSFVVLVVERK